MVVVPVMMGGQAWCGGGCGGMLWEDLMEIGWGGPCLPRTRVLTHTRQCFMTFHGISETWRQFTWTSRDELFTCGGANTLTALSGRNSLVWQKQWQPRLAAMKPSHRLMKAS